MDTERFRVESEKFRSLSFYKTDDIEGLADKEEGERRLDEIRKQLILLQEKLYASNSHAFLLIFQAMDGAGKDSTIEHVTSGINPVGFQVYSFKQPSAEELDHDFLWRTTRCLPERGRIGIFNRSYYEEVLIVKVHPAYIVRQRIPGIDTPDKVNRSFWQERYESINNFEKHLVRNGTQVLKFFLHLSKPEQSSRFLKRIEEPEKNWKFALSDIEERQFWDDYQEAYSEMLLKTSTKLAPWYVIPADRKWYMRVAVAEILQNKMLDLNLKVPEMTGEQKADMEKGRQLLLSGN